MSWRSTKSGKHYPIGRRHGSSRPRMSQRGSSMEGMGKLTYKERQRLPDRDFAVILKDGTRKYPIENEAHARNALARVSRFGNPEEKAEVRRKVHERYPNIGEKDDPYVVVVRGKAD